MSDHRARKIVKRAIKAMRAAVVPCPRCVSKKIMHQLTERRLIALGFAKHGR